MVLRWGLVHGNYRGYVGWENGRLYLFRIWIEFRRVGSSPRRATSTPSWGPTQGAPSGGGTGEDA